MDVDTINVLESAYWTPRGEYFDFATGDSISALEMLQKIANAGKSRFLLSDGLATVNREGIKPWTGVITPHEMVEELQSGFTVPSDDDFDGVDVTYINGTTWAEETVKCRTPDNPTPVKIENYKTRWGTESGSRLPDRHASPDEIPAAAGDVPDHYRAGRAVLQHGPIALCSRMIFRVTTRFPVWWRR
ncbi:putative kinase [Klebsiella variicola]|nr:putative kinase [Klebsiella variicola]